MCAKPLVQCLVYNKCLLNASYCCYSIDTVRVHLSIIIAVLTIVHFSPQTYSSGRCPFQLLLRLSPPAVCLRSLPSTVLLTGTLLCLQGDPFPSSPAATTMEEEHDFVEENCHLGSSGYWYVPCMRLGLPIYKAGVKIVFLCIFLLRVK